MRIATWNVNSVTARLPRLLTWLDEAQPDVACLQEIKCRAEAFPFDEIESRGYEVAAHGDGRWNGVAILSRLPMADVTLGFKGQPGFAAGVAGSAAAASAEEAGPLELDLALDLDLPPAAPVEARAVGATCGPLRLWSVYVPNGRALDSPHYEYKLAWLAGITKALADEVAGPGPFVVTGDFNIIPTDADVWDPSAFVGATHVSEAERSALAGLRALGLSDVAPRALKYDTPYTYWDYRALMFPKNQGMRIDLVYANAPAAAAVRDAYVDREARKGKGASDHAPVVVDLDL